MEINWLLRIESIRIFHGLSQLPYNEGHWIQFLCFIKRDQAATGLGTPVC